MSADTEAPSSGQVGLAAVMLIMTPLFWAGHSVVGRIIANDIPTFSLVSLRWIVAAAIFGLFVGRGAWAERYVLIKHWRYVVLAGIVGPALFPCFLYFGLKTTTVTNTSIIQTIVPALIPFIAWAVLKDRVTWAQVLGIAVSMGGVLFMITQGDISTLMSVTFVEGDLYILGGFIMWSIYTVVIRLKPPEISANTFLLGSMIVAGLVTLPLWVSEASMGRVIPVTWDTVWPIGYIIVFPTLLAYFFYNHAVAIVGPTKAGLASHLVPPLGILLGVVFLNEILAPYHFISFGLVAIGVVTVLRGGRVSSSPKPS